MKDSKSKKYGKQMLKVSEKYLEENIRMFTLENTNDYEDCVRAIYKDAADLRVIGDYLRSNDLAAAYRVAIKLDTIVREEVPEKIWKYITAEYSE